MTVLRLARSELKRMTGGILPKLTIVALSLVPLLYGAVYLYANWDPYSNLDGIKAALVVEDEGAYPSKPDGTKGDELRAGEKVADNLVDKKLFDWERVPTSAAADEGVRTGQYAFALKIPKDFSANLVSPSSFDSAEQAMLNVTTNDANNYLLSSIVDKLTTAVHTTVANEVGEQTADQLLTGFGVIHQNMVKAADGAKSLDEGIAKLDDGAGTLHKGTGDLVNGVGELRNGQAQLLDGAKQLANGTSQLHGGATKLNDGAAALAAGAGQLNNGLGQLDRGASALPGNTAKLADGAAQVAAGNATLNNKVQGAITELKTVEGKALKDLDSALDKLVDSGTLTKDDAAKIREDFKEVQGADPVKEAREKVETAASSLQQLADGSAAVSNGAKQLAAAAPTLANGIHSAHDGSEKLLGGINTLKSGTSELVNGAGQLNTGAGKLVDGEQSALNGVVKLGEGAGKLNDGAGQLKDGLDKAGDGSGELADKLAKGSGQIPNPNETQRESVSKVMADPVAVDNVSQAKASSYGAGLAPFFLSLSLWIGAFMLVQAMRPLTQRALVSNAPSWKIATGGWLPFFVVSAVQTALLWAVVTWGLKLESANPALTFVFLLFAAMAFTALIQGVVALMGTPGKFVVLILLVLQLVSSGGTFPWQTTPQPFHVVHELLPLGYVVTGMRHLVYGGDLTMVMPIMFGLIGYTLIGLLMSVVAVQKHKTWTLKTFKPEIAV